MDNLPDSVAGWLKPAAKSVLKYRRVRLSPSPPSSTQPRLIPLTTTTGYPRSDNPHPSRRIHQSQRRQTHHLRRNPLRRPPPRGQDDTTTRRRIANHSRRRRTNYSLCSLNRLLPHHHQPAHLRATARRSRRRVPQPHRAGPADPGEDAVSESVYYGGTAIRIWT